MAPNHLKPLFIRADSTAHIGTGHILRCLALAQAWQDHGGEVTFISHCESGALRQRLIDERMNFINISKPHPDPSDLKQTSEILISKSHQPSTNCWLVIDGYHFDTVYQKNIKDAGYRILWIDDYGHAAHYYADLVLNQNISVDETLYANREPYTRLLLGTRYALLRREFKKWQDWQREIPDTAQKVLVTMGGGDPDNVTMKVVQALKQINIKGLEAKIIVGPANPNLHPLKEKIGNNKNLQIVTNVTNMPELLAWGDIAVSAGGSTCWEMALLGLPNIIMYFADNQRPIAEKLHEYGAALSMGWSHQLSIKSIKQYIKDMLLSRERRNGYSIKSQDLVDGKGAQKVCCEIFS